MDNPKYSILIPTFNKVHYLKFTIESILSINFEDFELIVSDDYSNDGTDKYLSTLKDDRLKIIKPPFKLTQAKNYEYILSFAKGEWITIIGDDDAILPNFFEILNETIKNLSNEIEVISSKPANYYWDNVENLYGDRVVNYQNFFSKDKTKNSKINLFLTLIGLKNRNDLPMLYTSGVIKKTLIDRIKLKSNNFFFHSIIPDYYSSISILYEAKKFLRINQPIFWVGVSSKSTGIGNRIYEDSVRPSDQNYPNINQNLKINEKISLTLHQTGTPTIYYYECLHNHPYINGFWRSKLVKLLSHLSSLIYFKNNLLKQPYRIKNNISFQDYKSTIYKELKTDYSNIYITIIYYFIYILHVFNKKIQLIDKILIFLKKKIVKKNIILISNNRDKYPNIKICNEEINKLLGKKN